MSPWLSDVLLRSQSDERLVALAREGREKAFTTLVERYDRPLLAFARSLGAGPRAEDVVQQALMQAWSALLDGAEVEHVRGWLHQIVRNAAWKSAARTPRAVELPDTLVGSAGPHDEVEERIQVRSVVDEVAKLPERQRAALVQSALEGRSREEIAVGLGLTEGAVRQLVHRGRSTVRAACTALTPGPALAWAATPRQGGSMSERVAEALTGGGAAGLTGVLVKGGAVVVAAGALVTTTITPVHQAKPTRAGIAAITPVVRDVADRSTAAGASGAGAHGDRADSRRSAAAPAPGHGRSGRGRGRGLGATGAGSRGHFTGTRNVSRRNVEAEHHRGGEASAGHDPAGRSGSSDDSRSSEGSGRSGGDDSHSGSGSSGPSGSDGSSDGSGSSGSGTSSSGTSGSGSGSSGSDSGESITTGSREGGSGSSSGDLLDPTRSESGSGSLSGPG